jgi:hypothetical protein
VNPLIARIIHGQRHPVRPVFQRRAAQFPQRMLQTVAQTFKAFRVAQRDVLPIRVRQHKVIQHVGKALPPYRDAQFVHVREVGLTQPSRHMLLSEKHFPFGPFGRPPLLQPTLQRANPTVGKSARVFSLQRFEKRPRIQSGIRPDLLSDFIPHSRERIGSCPPCPVHLTLARQPRVRQIFPGGLRVHARLCRRQFPILLCL